MKYCKELAENLKNVPFLLQKNCISYKAWKKRCNEVGFITSDYLDSLKKECRLVNKIFCHLYKLHVSSNNRCSKLNWLCSSRLEFEYIDIFTDARLVYNFAKINAQTVYKVCKRIAKVTEKRDAMDWLTLVRQEHIYDFLGGSKLTHLSTILNNPQTIECPICFEHIEKQHMLIMTCGHYTCLQCILVHTDMAKRRGMWYNLLASAKRHDCPICRCDHSTCAAILI